MKYSNHNTDVEIDHSYFNKAKAYWKRKITKKNKTCVSGFGRLEVLFYYKAQLQLVFLIGEAVDIISEIRLHC